MMRSIVVLVAGGLLSICAVTAQAQDAILGQMYGNGVHAYFAGDYLRAYGFLTKAIEAGSRDPRCYYFRGLAYLNLGRPQEAEGDFQQGAKFETADLNKTYSVAKSLERVQGPARLDLEQYRAAARMAALEQAEKLRKQRYEEMNREERRTLESQVGPPSEKPGGAEVAPPPDAKPLDNPFAAPPAPGGHKAAPAGEVKKEGEDANTEEVPAEKGKPAEGAKPADENANPFATPSEKAPDQKPAASDKGKKAEGATKKVEGAKKAEGDAKKGAKQGDAAGDPFPPD